MAAKARRECLPMGGRVSNIGAARRFPRWEGHWKTPTDQSMAADSRSECTRRESAAKRSAIWDRMAEETRCEHSCQEFPVSLPAAKGKPIRGAVRPDGKELKEENIATSRAWRRGWSAGGDWPHSQPIDLLPEGDGAWVRRKWQAVGLAAAPESASRVYAWGKISDRRGSTAIGRQAQCQKGHPACTHGVGF